MSKMGRAIQEMEEMGIEPIQKNLSHYVEIKRKQKESKLLPKEEYTLKKKTK
jgi:hypothetical protein